MLKCRKKSDLLCYRYHIVVASFRLRDTVGLFTRCRTIVVLECSIYETKTCISEIRSPQHFRERQNFGTQDNITKIMDPFGVKANFLAVATSSYLALRAHKRKSLTPGGSIAAFAVAFFLVGTGLRGMNLLTFYFISIKATKYKVRIAVHRAVSDNPINSFAPFVLVETLMIL